MPQSTPPPEPVLDLNPGCLLGLAAMAWLAITLWTVPPPSSPVPYSVLVQQARAGNVQSLQVEGESLTGVFTKPVTLGDPRKPPPAARRVERFRTVAPSTLGPSDLLRVLEGGSARVDVLPTPLPWGVRLLLYAVPVVAVLLLLSARNRKVDAPSLFSFGRSHPRIYGSSQPGATFGDVAGCDDAKAELLTEIDFLRNPAKYHALGARIPRGVLLVGPPGTGKTLLARAVAGEAGVPFFSVSASEFVEIFVGVGASRVRDLFAKAKAAAPAILFVDELDAVGRRRGAGVGGANDEREQTLNQLLVEMDGFDERQDVIVLAATNRPDILDRALLRPGRFDRQVEVPLPDRAGREAILRVHSRTLPLEDEVDLAALAAGTPGFSGADLANLCNEAALLAARFGNSRVGARMFEEAQDKLVLGGVRALLLKPHERRAVAFHEAGHALVAWLTPEADPVHKVSIIPRGRALGATEQTPADDRYHCSRTWLGARLATLLAGRAAEELVFGEVSTGAENDLQEATRLARRMVTAWGMGTLGPVSYLAGDGERGYGEATASRIDEDVQRLLLEGLEGARGVLQEHRADLGRLAEALLERETLDHGALVALLGEMTGVRTPHPEPRPAEERVPAPLPAVIAAAWADGGQGREGSRGLT